MAGRRRVATAVVGALVLLAGCGSGTGPPEPTPVPAPDPTVGDDPTTGDDPTLDAGSALTGDPTADLSAEVIRYRRDAQRAVVQVKVSSRGGTPVHVTRVRLETPTFTAPVEVDEDTRVRPGVSVDLPVPLGEPACPLATSGPHRVLLEVDGTDVVLPVPGDVLVQVGTERCLARQVRRQVGLAVAPTWAEAGPVLGEPALRGAVVATRASGPGSDAPVRLAVRGATTLFTVAEPAETSLPPGPGESAELPVLLTVTRCDAHAVAEDKKGYLLPVRVAVDGGEPVLVEVAVPVPERAPLQRLLDTTCRTG